MDGVGLTDVTALTRESTSQTVYDTRASTSSTVYGVRKDARYSIRLSRYLGEDTYGYTTVYYFYNSSWVPNTDGYCFTGDNLTVRYKDGSQRAYGSIQLYGYIIDKGLYAYKSVTTGTTYQTRTSTYNTRYLTCESTSAYSGVSSSSSSVMSWV